MAPKKKKKGDKKDRAKAAAVDPAERAALRARADAAGVPVANFRANGGPITVQVSSGFAQPGAYTLYLWEKDVNVIVKKYEGNFLNSDDDVYDLPKPPAANESRYLQALVTVAITPPVTDYSVALTVTQDGVQLAEDRKTDRVEGGGDVTRTLWVLLQAAP